MSDDTIEFYDCSKLRGEESTTLDTLTHEFTDGRKIRVGMQPDLGSVRVEITRPLTSGKTGVLEFVISNEAAGKLGEMLIQATRTRFVAFNDEEESKP